MARDTSTCGRGLLLLLLLLLPPLPALQVSGLTAPIMYPERRTWKEAQAFCREHHIDLVTIRTEEENQLTHQDLVWIGLYQDHRDHVWKWSKGEESATFLPWYPGEPNDEEKCVLKLANATSWMNHGCNKTFPFLCSDHNLVLVNKNQTWEEALDHCRSLGGLDQNRTYDLARLLGPTHQVYALQEVQDASTDEVWTGLRFLAGRWFWVGAGPVQDKHLLGCPGLRSCGVLEKRGGTNLQTRDCSQRRNFLCSKTP